ncbi:MAG: N-acetyltransferase [Planctomycetes bacterium]|nr:N-acetyltransferase [Planctomycetota bacterium]
MACVPPEGVFVHPAAICESSVVGAGTKVWAFAHVLEGAEIGRDCNIGDHTFIEGGARIGDRVTIKNQALIWEGVTIEDDAFVGPGVIFTNDRFPRSPRTPSARERYQNKSTWLEPTIVRRGASIGAGVIVICGVTIGRWAVVGAGAVVTRSVADHRLAIGRPARSTGWACVCGRALSEGLVCPACGRRFVLHGEQLTIATAATEPRP